MKGLVRVDEGFLILSSDFIHEFLAKKRDLLCHLFGDQTIALWMNEAKDVIFFHDPRVYHHVSANAPDFKVQREICQSYLGVHGSYLSEMLRYWEIASKESVTEYLVPPIQPLGELCPLSTYFDWREMTSALYGQEPKPCRLKPVWHLGNMHRGRQ